MTFFIPTSDDDVDYEPPAPDEADWDGPGDDDEPCAVLYGHEQQHSHDGGLFVDVEPVTAAQLVCDHRWDVVELRCRRCGVHC